MSIFVAAGLALAQSKPTRPPDPPPANGQEQEPPEEDPDLKPKEYSFNPLEAQQSVTAGSFYFKKETTAPRTIAFAKRRSVDPTSGEALLRLAEAAEKLHNYQGAREAYTKYLAFDPAPKDSETVKKKLDKLPQDPHAKKK